MSASYMKKWEEKNRDRHHHRRIQSAKSTVRKTALGNQRIVDIKSPVHTPSSNPSHDLDYYPTGDSSDSTRPSSSKLSDYYSYEKENLPQIPLYRLLKHFSLQQYAKALISRGYGYDIAKLGTVSTECLNELMNDINVLPGHKVKLRQLISQITKVCSEIIEEEDMNFSIESLKAQKVAASKPSTAQARSRGHQTSHSTPKQGTKKPSSAIAGRRPLSTKTNYPNQKKNDNLDKVANKERVEKGDHAKIVKIDAIGVDFFSDSNDSNNDEFSLILNDIIEKYQHEGESEKVKPQCRAPIEQQKRNVQATQPEDLMQRVHKVYNNEGKGRLNQMQPVRQQSPTKKVVQKLNLEKTKSKPKEIIKTEPTKQNTKIRGLSERELQKKSELEKKEEFIEESPQMKAKVMDLLEQKLDPKNLNRDDLNLEFNKIKDLYSSFDGAKMTSTIANIDIEEMCHCFACAIQKHIEFFIQNVYPLGDAYSAKPNTEANNFKDDNKENVKNLKINQAVPKETTETIIKPQIKPKPKEVQEQKREEEIEYNEGDDYFIYKGKKIPIGSLDDEDEVEDPFSQGTSDRHGTIFQTEKEDEVMHDEDDGIYEDDFETEDNVKNMKAAPKEEPQEAYNEEEFNDFLRQSLRENLLDTMKKANPGLQSQIEEQRLRLDQVCQTKSNIQALLKPKEEDIEEDLYEEEEQQPEYSEFSFTMEESQYREIELSTEELDQAKRTKRLFDKTYNEKSLTPEEYNKRIKDTVSKDTISNFCKNLMVTSKMEKEVIIVSLVYVERLIVKTNLYLNNLNWKKICFTAFVLASKIWDDESFENEHFAKVFPQYTVKDINELEKVFLQLIDYDLRVNGTDYAKYYFILRTFAEKNKKSFALKPMNVQVVRMLQNKAEGTSQSLKSKYLENINRSFM